MVNHGMIWDYPLVICYSLLLKMTTDIVDLPIENIHMVIFQFVM